jgi:excisionase family DNA binding protein
VPLSHSQTRRCSQHSPPRDSFGPKQSFRRWRPTLSQGTSSGSPTSTPARASLRHANGPLGWRSRRSCFRVKGKATLPASGVVIRPSEVKLKGAKSPSPAPYGQRTKLILTVEQLAERFQLSPKTIYRALERRELRAAKLGNRWRIRLEDAERWFDEHVPQDDLVEER